MEVGASVQLDGSLQPTAYSLQPTCLPAYIQLPLPFTSPPVHFCLDRFDTLCIWFLGIILIITNFTGLERHENFNIHLDFVGSSWFLSLRLLVNLCSCSSSTYLPTYLHTHQSNLTNLDISWHRHLQPSTLFRQASNNFYTVMRPTSDQLHCLHLSLCYPWSLLSITNWAHYIAATMPQWDKTRNYYADLEIPPNASADDIKKQYRKLGKAIWANKKYCCS